MRQHIMGISERRQILLLAMLLPHIIAQPGERAFQRIIGHILAVLLRAQQEIGGIGVEPRHRFLGLGPYAEAAIRALQFDDMTNRAIDRLARVEAGIGPPQPGDRLDIQ